MIKIYIKNLDNYEIRSLEHYSYIYKDQIKICEELFIWINNQWTPFLYMPELYTFSFLYSNKKKLGFFTKMRDHGFKGPLIDKLVEQEVDNKIPKSYLIDNSFVIMTTREKFNNAKNVCYKFNRSHSSISAMGVLDANLLKSIIYAAKKGIIKMLSFQITTAFRHFPIKEHYRSLKLTLPKNTILSNDHNFLMANHDFNKAFVIGLTVFTYDTNDYIISPIYYKQLSYLTAINFFAYKKSLFIRPDYLEGHHSVEEHRKTDRFFNKNIIKLLESYIGKHDNLIRLKILIDLMTIDKHTDLYNNKITDNETENLDYQCNDYDYLLNYYNSNKETKEIKYFNNITYRDCSLDIFKDIYANKKRIINFKENPCSIFKDISPWDVMKDIFLYNLK
nr:hypothetical protein [Oedogonium sp. 1_circle_61917]